MRASVVIEAFDIVEDIQTEIFKRAVVFSAGTFLFEVLEEGLTDGVIKGVSFL